MPIHEMIESIPESVFNWTPTEPAVILVDDRGHKWFLATVCLKLTELTYSIMSYKYIV